MADWRDNLTNRARAALAAAEAEARAANHHYIGTEHILLGLAVVTDGLAARALTEMEVGPERVRTAVLLIIGCGNEPAPPQIGLTPRAKKALDLALDEAKRLNHHYIGTEHMLLGLIREGEGIAAIVLKSLGVDLDQASAVMLRLLAEGPSPGSAIASTATSTRDTASVDHLIAQWMERALKRYNLALPEELYAEVQALADRQHTSVVELLRRFIKLGLLATSVQERPDAALIIREGEREREILLL